MEIDSLRKKTVRGIAWSSAERFSTQAIQFLIMLVLARFLDPKDFGMVGMLTVFLAISQSLIDSGFSQALIQKKNRTNVDNCTVFYFNIVVSLVMYGVLFLFAPSVADFYNEPQLTMLMRVLCLVLVINSFSIVHRALYTAHVDFKTQAKASFISVLISGTIGLLLACDGYGVWTLVWQQIIRSSINSFLLWVYSTWHPIFLYSWQSFVNLFSFGSKLLLSGLIDTIYNNIYQVSIGKIYSASSLGYYTQANNLSSLLSSNLNGVIGSVSFPILCSIQDDNDRLAEAFRKSLKMSAFIIFPLMAGLAAVAYPLVFVILGPQWDVTATLLIPLCFAMMWYPIHAINLSLLRAKGRSDLFLKLEIIKKCLGVGILMVTIPLGLLAMCYGTIVTSLLSLIINMYYTGKLIKIGMLMQLCDLLTSLIFSSGVFLIMFLSVSFFSTPFYQLIMGIGAGVIFFVGTCYTINFKEVRFLRSLFNK